MHCILELSDGRSFEDVCGKFFVPNPEKCNYTKPYRFRLTDHGNPICDFMCINGDGGPICFNNSPSFSYNSKDFRYKIRRYQCSAAHGADSKDFYVHITGQHDKLYEILHVDYALS